MGRITDHDLAEGLARRDGNGKHAIIVAHRGRAARDGGVAQSLNCGTVEPQLATFDGHRERGGGDNIGQRGPLLEVERAVEGNVGIPAYYSVTEGVAGTLLSGGLVCTPYRFDDTGTHRLTAVGYRHASEPDGGLERGLRRYARDEHHK